MNIQEAKEEIIHTLHAYFAKKEDGSYAVAQIRQRPLLLIGAPGIGKTQIMRQIEEEEGVGLVSYTMTHHTRQSAIGLPLIEHRNYGGQDYSVTEYTMSEIIASVYDEMERSGRREGILFLDEINCVSETLAPTMLQFLQAKTFGNHRLPDGWLIVAAGNPPEYNKSVREFDIVTMDRIRKIEVQADLDVWKRYARRKLVHPSILAYLNIKPQYFCRIETTIDGRFFATPRGWEDLSELLDIYEKQNISVTRDIVAEYIQFPEIAKDFANYLELYYKYEARYRVDDILAGTIDEALCVRLEKAPFDETYSVIQLLLSRIAADCKELERTAKEAEAARAAYLEAKEKDGAEAAGGAAAGQSLEGVRLSVDPEVLRAAYNALATRYQDLFDRTGDKLEHAFDFMEAAFGTGDQMIVFMTELNYNDYLIRFLKEYDCARYYQYNKQLQFDVQADRLKEKAAAMLQS